MRGCQIRLSRGVRTAAILALGAVPSAGAETRVVVAGGQYAAGSAHRTFFGDDYRDLWTTPFAAEVLDLAKEAGGLAPVRRVGGQQTKGLALEGADGRNYTFRGLDKDASDILDEDLRGTIVERLLQDQTAAQHPASEVIARVLLDAAGVPCPAWRLVVMPDDEALGEFRRDFAGVVGVFAEYPSAATEATPGFREATEIIDHLKLYELLEAGRGDAVDLPAFLRARLMDILMGDWDRHRRQWRWAKVPGSALWQPIPEDRDQAFSRYEGLVLDIGRGRDPRLQKLAEKYSKVGGLVWNGREQDRRLLVPLEREAFRAAALDLEAKVTDAVIEEAARAMPLEWRRIDEERLVRILKARRDALPEIADRYYRHLADRVDVYLTHRSERVEAARRDGEMEVVVHRLDVDGKPAGEPTFRRVFSEDETAEVRVYGLDGNDRVDVTGGGGIRLRFVGGNGADTLNAAGSGDAKLSDSNGPSQVVDADVDDRPYTPPPPPPRAPWIPPRDFGRETWASPWVGYSSDIGLFLGGGLETHSFGFRKHPYASRQVVRAGFAFGEQSGRLDYRGEFRRENRSSWWGLYAFASGVEVLRFYGLGNETGNTEGSDFYKATTNAFVLYPTLGLGFGERTSLTVGPAVQYYRSDTDEDQLVNQLLPYGRGNFGETGVHAVLAFDGRDSRVFTRKGIFLAARGTYFPELWDVESHFGQVNGNVNAYVSAGQWLTLAVRGGGKRVFGTYPYQEAAYVGGGGLGPEALAEPEYTLRGFRARRFGGDGSVWGNADLRLRAFRMTLVLPAHFGVFGFADTGRVWLEGESSDEWHTGYGGGIWLSFLNYRSTFSAGIAHGDEGNLFYFGGGFTF